MNTDPLISVLMPVKNAAPFLDECLRSIIDQTESNWELLAIDDGSTDSSAEILHQHASTDQRIKVFSNNGNGIIDALRTAYTASHGKLITRMDADDRMTANKLEVLKKNILTAGQGNVAVGQVAYFAEGKLGDGYRKYEQWLNALTATGSNYTDIYRECVIPSPCWMVHRDDLDRCGAFEPITYPEDYDLCFRFYEAGLAVVPCNAVLHHWRDHSARTSRNHPHYADNRFLELKLNWFLRLDHDPQRPLVLWGAGEKGKKLAQLLSSHGIAFHWICNNPNKIGKEIYGSVMQAPESLSTINHPQVIVSVANPHEQAELNAQLTGEVFYFC